MPRFSANLCMLFAEHDFLDRFAAAAHAGFAGVEYIGPYDHPPEKIAELARPTWSQPGVVQPAAGRLGARASAASPCLPERVEEFRAGVDTGDPLRPGARLQPGQLPGRHRARRCVDRAGWRIRLSKTSPTRPTAGRSGHPAARSSRSTRATFRASSSPLAPGAGADRARRLEQPLPAIRHLSHADHGGGSRPYDRGQPRPHRPHPAGRQSRPARAGHGRDQLSVPVPPSRPSSAMTAGSAPNTGRRPARPRVSAG